MKKIIAILLALTFVAGILASCASGHESNDDKSKKTDTAESKEETESAKAETESEKSDLTFKGKWVLTSEKVKRQREKYTSAEFTSSYTAELYEHTYEHKYEPDPEDPADGPTPYSASYLCSCAIPSTLYPGDTERFTLLAAVEKDEKPGSNDGMCCSIDFWGLNPAPQISSKNGYDYSKSMYYPVCAGSTIEYGHLEAKSYKDGMNDYISVTMPVITKDMNPSAYDELIVTFMSNAGESEFVYTWVGED